MWLRCIPGCDLMNDDNPVVRVIDGEAMIYGSPWSGKTPCYRQVKAPLGAITQIDRAQAFRRMSSRRCERRDTAAVVLVDEMGREAARTGL